MDKHVHLVLDEDLRDRIDEARKTPAGEIPRNAWLRWAIEQQLDQIEAAAAKPRRRRSV